MASSGSSTADFKLCTPESQENDPDSSTPKDPKIEFELWTPDLLKRSSNAPAPQKEFACTFGDCNSSFDLKEDLLRHVSRTKKHQTAESQTHPCPAPGCPRKGVRGFLRKDKMREHFSTRHISFQLTAHFQKHCFPGSICHFCWECPLMCVIFGHWCDRIETVRSFVKHWRRHHSQIKFPKLNGLGRIWNLTPQEEKDYIHSMLNAV